MMEKRFRSLTALVAFAMTALLMGAPRDARAQVEPKAEQILKKMTDYLGRLESFSVQTENTVEDVLVSGEKIQNDFSASLVIQRPNKLHSEQTGYRFNQRFVYDGETLTAYHQEENSYAVAAAPDSIDDVLHFGRDTLGIVPPVGDIVFTDSFELLMTGVEAGGVVGKAIIDGVQCDQLFFSTPVVDWQIWIADGTEPLPYKYVLTTKDDPAEPQYTVRMSQWKAEPDVDDSVFEFTPPRGADRIEFILVGRDH